MKLLKIAVLAACLTIFTLPLSAQRIGGGMGVGTQGIAGDLALRVTGWLELGAGVNYMPGIKLSEDVDLGFKIPEGMPFIIPDGFDDVNIDGNLSRISFNIKASVYPFGAGSSFFISPALHFGGKRIIDLDGFNEAVAYYPNIREYVHANIGGYDLDFDSEGHIRGDVRVDPVRPYLGIGYGRLVPSRAVGFRVELGCEFMGKMKVYQDGKRLNINEFEEEGDDTISKFIDKWRYYPVLKLAVTF